MRREACSAKAMQAGCDMPDRSPSAFGGWGSGLWMFLWALSLVFALPAPPASAMTPEASLKKDFPELRYDRIGPGPVRGVIEVVVGSDILYYWPEEGVILTGEMIGRDRRNWTRLRKAALQSEQVGRLPLDLAVRIGEGPHRVIEFTDPNCTHCRRASAYLKGKAGLTRYVFFFPLSPRSETVIRAILCAPDRAKAYEAVMDGVEGAVHPEACADPQAENLQKRHREFGQRLGIEGTPFFVIDGEVVAGADIPRMEQLLSSPRPGAK